MTSPLPARLVSLAALENAVANDSWWWWTAGKSLARWSVYSMGVYSACKFADWMTSQKLSIFNTVPRRVEFANRCVAMTHALGCIALSAHALRTMLSVPAAAAATALNTPEQQRIVIFSIGYFLLDFAYLVAFDPNLMFLAHHVCALAFWSAVLRDERFGAYIAVGALLGELTNPLQLVWQYAKKYRMERLHRPLARPFTYLFIAVRCVAFPFVAVFLLNDVFFGQSAASSTRTKLTLCTAIVVLVGGGFVWSSRLWRGHRRSLRTK